MSKIILFISIIAIFSKTNGFKSNSFFGDGFSGQMSDFFGGFGRSLNLSSHIDDFNGLNFASSNKSEVNVRIKRQVATCGE